MDGLLDQRLGGAFVNDKNESVVVFNSLDSAFGTSGLLNNGVLVPGDLLLDTVRNSFGFASKSKSLGASESDLVPLLGLGSGVGSLLHYFSSLCCL